MLRLETDAHFRNFFVSMMVINSVSSFVTSVLNFLTILTFVKTTSLRTPSYILILSLAISDFSVGVLLQPAYFSLMFAQWTRNVPLWKIGLIIVSKVFPLLVTASFLTVTAVTIDRFLAIHMHLDTKDLSQLSGLV